ALRETAKPREVGALAHAPRLALGAFAAAEGRFAGDGAADEPLADAAADAAHDARVLVAEHERWLVGEEALRGVHVGAADARRLHFDHDLAQPRNGLRHLVDREPRAAVPGGDLHCAICRRA